MIERIFTGYERPILHTLLEHLDQFDQHGVVDLSQTVLILPTRNVGRRVREQLAIRAGESNRAALSPLTLTPGSLFSSLAPEEKTFRPASQILAVINVLESLSSEVLQRAFGREEFGGFNESLSFARVFLHSRRTLAEGLFDCASVSRHPSIPDRDRWAALATIEAKYRSLLQNERLLDPDDWAAEMATAPSPCPEWKRIIVAGTPDFPERTAVFLRNLSQTVPVEILILARPEEEAAFDDVGRPLESWFLKKSIEIPEEFLHIATDVVAANERIATQLVRYPDSRSAAVCGVGQAVDGDSLAYTLTSRRVPAYNPAGVPFVSTPQGRFLQILERIAFGEDPEDFASWLRDPFVATWVANEGESLPREEWIQGIDQIRAESLPATIGSFLQILKARGAKPKIIGLTQKIRKIARKVGNIFQLLESEEMRTLLTTIEREDGVTDFAKNLFTIREASQQYTLKSDSALLGQWAIKEALQFSIYPERPAEVIEVLGWLELLWDEHPWLQIPDFYDGSIPGETVNQPFIPEALLRELSLPSRKQRDTRDAYILKTLIRLRKDGGRVDLYVPGRDLTGKTVSPSRFLFYTDEHDLSKRIALVSKGPIPSEAPTPAPSLLFDPSAKAPHSSWLSEIDRIYVTSFASWIRCPFTFYLERVCGMTTVEPDRMEMDPRYFGTAVHEVMRILDETLMDKAEWEDLDKVQTKATELLENWFSRVFGRKTGLLLQLQKEAIHRRISAAVSIRRETRIEGWTPMHIEWNFRPEGLLEIDGIPLSGQIDLVEERGDEIRLIDYKTSDQAESPSKAHLENIERKKRFSPSSLLTINSEPGSGWRNLQLPLYAKVIAEKYPERPIRVAYILLPKAVTESRLEEWKEFSLQLAEEAVEAAEKIVDLWKNAGFWPPSSTFERSDAFDWSGPEGREAWQQGTLLDLSTLATEGK
ncbi:MAG: PD-(D/E)XK nuclease family protein [Verrucomicrobiota bacterium]